MAPMTADDRDRLRETDASLRRIAMLVADGADLEYRVRCRHSGGSRFARWFTATVRRVAPTDRGRVRHGPRHRWEGLREIAHGIHPTVLSEAGLGTRSWHSVDARSCRRRYPCLRRAAAGCMYRSVTTAPAARTPLAPVSPACATRWRLSAVRSGSTATRAKGPSASVS